METTINKKLVFDHFENRTSPLQKVAIETWLNSTANEELFYEWLEEWERQHLQYDAKSDAGLQRFFSNVESDEFAIEKIQDSTVWNRFGSWMRAHGWKVVAAFILVAGLGWFYRNDVRYKYYQTAYGQVKEFRLDDGTLAKLNGNSLLEVPRWNFGASLREVHLKGDASFNVTHLSDSRRFIVKTPEEFEVVVLGTEFTMSARRFGSKVILTNGRVQLLFKEENQTKQLIMQPGDVIRLNKNKKIEVSHTTTPGIYSEWENKRFVFEETTLEEMGYQLEATLGMKVIFSNRAIADRRLTGSFKGVTIEELLQSVAEVLDLTVTYEKDQAVFSEK